MYNPDRSKVMVILEEGEMGSYAPGWPDTLPGVINRLQALEKKVPEEFREQSFLEVNAQEYSVEYEVGYTRPKTDSDRRDEQEKESKAEAKKRESDIATLKRLNQEFPGVLQEEQ